MSAARGESLRQARVRLILWIVLASAALGAIYGHISFGSAGIFRSALAGMIISAIAASAEVFWLQTAFRGTAFLVFLTLRSLVYAAAILFGTALATWLVDRHVNIDRTGLLFSIAVSLAMNFVFAVNRLLGPGVLVSFVAGRYHQPRIEERVLLFIDLESSTRIAERLGEVRFLVFLNRFITDVSEAIVRERGEIHKYVGDELIVTWKLAAGLKDARCIRGCFDALDRLELLAPDYQREFGARANFRAALHCGPVVLGELGAIKQEIALLGDNMNTAARLQQACRDTGNRVLASAALIGRIETLPPGIVARALGPMPLRGKASALEVYALEAERRVMMTVPA